jgi:hypothetical protein
MLFQEKRIPRPASTGCAIGLGKEYEWVVRMIRAEVPRIHLLGSSVNKASSLLWETWSFFWVVYCCGRKEMCRDE